MPEKPRYNKDKLTPRQRLRRVVGIILSSIVIGGGIAEAKIVPKNQAEVDEITLEAVGQVPREVEKSISNPHQESITESRADELSKSFPDIKLRFEPRMVRSGVISDGENLSPDPESHFVDNLEKRLQECEPYTILMGKIEFSSTDSLDIKNLVLTGPDGKEIYKDIEESTTTFTMQNPRISSEPNGIGFTAFDESNSQTTKVVVSWPSMIEAMIGGQGEVGPDDPGALMRINGVKVDISNQMKSWFMNYNNSERHLSLNDLNPIPDITGDYKFQTKKVLEETSVEAQQAFIEVLEPFLVEVSSQTFNSENNDSYELGDVKGQVVGTYSSGAGGVITVSGPRILDLSNLQKGLLFEKK